MHSHRPPLPNPQPDPGPLPDPAPLPSPEPGPAPEPLPPPFGAHETGPVYVETGEIGHETFYFGNGQGAPEWPTSVRVPVRSMPNERGVTSGIRLGLALVIALTMCASCEPRKPPPMVFRGDTPMLQHLHSSA